MGARNDLEWLIEQNALDGVAEILRERRRQIEKGFTPGYDAGHVNGELVTLARHRLNQLEISRKNGTGGPALDERFLAEAAALLTAEIDRLNREFTPPSEPVTMKYTPQWEDVHLPGDKP